MENLPTNPEHLTTQLLPRQRGVVQEQEDRGELHHQCQQHYEQGKREQQYGDWESRRDRKVIHVNRIHAVRTQCFTENPVGKGKCQRREN